MDFNSLRDQVSNLTLYDVKAGVRKMQNGMFAASIERLGLTRVAVMNYTEMESKVSLARLQDRRVSASNKAHARRSAKQRTMSHGALRRR
jgi:hypothetical protein